MHKTLFDYPWIRDRTRRKYMLGCLKAFMKAGFQRTFYDLGKVGYWGPQSKQKVDFGFDSSRRFEAPAGTAPANAIWKTMHRRKPGGGTVPAGAAAKACGGGVGELEEADRPPAR